MRCVDKRDVTGSPSNPSDDHVTMLNGLNQSLQVTKAIHGVHTRTRPVRSIMREAQNSYLGERKMYLYRGRDTILTII